MVSKRKKFFLRWRKAGMGLRLTTLVLGVAAFALLIYWQKPEDELVATRSSLLVLVAVNLNIVFLCVLAFLIGRNVVKLIFDRRRKILGSHLRMRLVVAFVGLTLIPIIILFVLASGLLTRAMEGWFSSQVESSVSGAVEVAKHHYLWLKKECREQAERLASELQAQPTLLKNKDGLEDYLERARKRGEIYGLKLLKENGDEIVGVHNAAAVIESFSEPILNADAIDKAAKKEASVLFEEKDSGQFIRTYFPLAMGASSLVLVATMRVNPELSQAMATVNDSFRQYEQLKLFRVPLKSGYILTLALMTGLLLFSAVWIAFYMARGIAVPIQRLAEATRSVAKGRYDIHIREVGGDEMSLLVRSFNQMTSDLKSSRKDAEQRRVYLETILSNLAVGVIGLDREKHVTSMNAAASRIFGVQDIEDVVGRNIIQVVGAEGFAEIRTLLETIESRAEDVSSIAEQDLTINSQGRELKVLCTGGTVRDSSGRALGYVLLFDDITELSRAQHMAAWREVAQRIAHEIKNPLTPIQLSAQRLSKLLGEYEDAIKESGPNVSDNGIGSKMVECTQTIVEHVDSIKRLANEFSKFARMPRAEFELSNLNSLIADTLAPYARSHSDIVFQFIADSDLPELMMDQEQLRRVIINLIDNAVAALRTKDSKAASGEGLRVVVKSNYDRRHKIASVEIADNGPGIPSHEKNRIFEPYFTTKKGGTGLGLAICTSIVSDHQGELRVYDNQPHGTKFIVTMPISQTKVTLRRFAQG